MVFHIKNIMKILVLAGGYDQIALIMSLQKRGHEVLLADYLDNPPAKKYVKKHYKVSTLDEDKIFNIAYSERVDLITTACTDQALLTVAKVSEQLKLPCYLSYYAGLQVTNKQYMKDIFFKNGIPTARYVIFRDWNSFLEGKGSVKFPSVVKPCDCNSSKGVKKVQNFDELCCAVERAFELSRSKTVIVEEFIEGTEISIDAWVDSQGSKILSVTETHKMEISSGNFTIIESKYPTQMSSKLWDKIVYVANRIAKSFKLENSPLLIQAIVSNEQISVIEFSARMGGGTKYKLIEYMSNVNIMEKYVERILGNVGQIIQPEFSADFFLMEYIYATKGRFKELKNFIELKEQKEIEDFFQYKEPGTVITKAKTSSDRVAGIILKAKDEKELQDKKRRVLKNIDVLDTFGNSMVINNF